MNHMNKAYIAMLTREDSQIMNRARAYLPAINLGDWPNKAREFTPASFVAQVMMELSANETMKLAGVCVPAFVPTYPNGRHS